MRNRFGKLKQKPESEKVSLRGEDLKVIELYNAIIANDVARAAAILDDPGSAGFINAIIDFYDSKVDGVRVGHETMNAIKPKDPVKVYFDQDPSDSYALYDIFYHPSRHHDMRTLLWLAIKKDNLEMVELLLRHGANPNMRVRPIDLGDRDDLPLLHVSATYEDGVPRRRIEMVELLLDHGANPNAHLDDQEYTVLDMFVIRGEYEVVDMILRKGLYISPELKCLGGRSKDSFELAITRYRDTLAKDLDDGGVSVKKSERVLGSFLNLFREIFSEESYNKLESHVRDMVSVDIDDYSGFSSRLYKCRSFREGVLIETAKRWSPTRAAFLSAVLRAGITSTVPGSGYGGSELSSLFTSGGGSAGAADALPSAAVTSLAGSVAGHAASASSAHTVNPAAVGTLPPSSAPGEPSPKGKGGKGCKGGGCSIA